MINSVDPDQTAPIGGSTLFASIHKFVSNVRQLFAPDDFSRRIFFRNIFFMALEGLKDAYCQTSWKIPSWKFIQSSNEYSL